MRVVITIPAFNEEKTIGKVIDSIWTVVNSDREAKKHEYKLLVVDDGSTDRTAELAKEHNAIVFSHPRNYGLAETFKTEINLCLTLKADAIIHIDADGQYLAKDIPKLLREIENGCDLVLGSRFLGHIESMPLIKRLGNMAFSKVVSSITGLKITDAQTGFRAFTREVAKAVSIQSTHTYTQEQIIRAAKKKFRIKEVPVYFAKRKGKSRLMKNAFDYAIKAGINLIRVYRDYEPLKFFGSTGVAFLLSGFSIGIWLVYRWLTLGKIAKTPSVVLSSLLIIVGVQIIFFGFLADMNKKS